MSAKRISRSPDLQRLWDDGYDVEIRAGHLLVKNVPYVNARREVCRGVLVTPLAMAGDVTVRPDTHVVMFVGEQPCRADGTPIASIQHSTERIPIAPGLEANHRFSNKPPAGYSDYYEKMTTYATILSGPAEAIDPTATAKVNRFVEPPEDESMFHYLDTASSKAGIGALNEKLAVDRVAIVGLGGTGSYVLDFIAKTHIKQIDLFDGEPFLQHNAFRSPGAASREDLEAIPTKVEYLAQLYGKMRAGVVPHPEFIGPENLDALRGASFVFLCMDRGAVKRAVVEKLLEWQVPFVDVGMGVDQREDSLAGVLRVTTVTPGGREHALGRIPFSDADPEAEYSRNIQIAELNALCAALAVIRWKKYAGYYDDREREHHTTYTLDTNVLTNEDKP